MTFLEKLENTILEKKIIQPGMHLLLAVSGGADSVCLLRTMAALREKLKIKLSVCHVHHGLRGENAERDAVFVRDISDSLNIPFRLVRIDTMERVEATGESVEEAARILRYEALFKVKEEIGADWIALAHHMDDQAETILFQMVRGSALKGLSGMPETRDGIVRPFLGFTEDEIRDYLRENGYKYRKDETNISMQYTRNRIRTEVLPALWKIRQDAAKKIADTGAYLGKVQDYLIKTAEEFLRLHAVFETEKKSCRIEKEAFGELHEVMSLTVAEEALRRCQCPMKDKGRAQFEAIVGLSEKTVGKRVDIGSGFEAVSDYDAVIIRPLAGDQEKTCPESGRISMPELSIRIFDREKEEEIPQKEYTKWFDCDKINDEIVLRTRCLGDRFSTYPGTHKKLNDFFTDIKLPLEKRDSVPVVAAGSDILWIVGIRMSEAYKVTASTAKIMEITIRGDIK